MTESQLMYAAMLALTKQNMAYKLSPLSTATHSGMCISRNITVGETVGLYYNAGSSLLRMGDVPGYTNDFWVDDDNRFYTIDTTNHRLIVKDGLGGDILNDTIDAYDFIVAGAKTCCAFRSSQNENQWIVILPDGSMTVPISILSTNSAKPSFGYRNGIIGICVGDNNGWYGVDSYTYSATGQYLATMQKSTELAASAYLVLPISENAIGYSCDSLSAWINLHLASYTIATTTSYTRYSMWEGYSIDNQGTSNVWLGADQSYVYVSARHYLNDPDQGISEWTNEYYTGRFSIDNYNGLELLRTEISEEQPYSRTNATQKGTVIHSNKIDGNTSRVMLDLSTMSELYGDVLTNIPSNYQLVRENDGFIWISGMGVYQKTPNGWLMYPTSVYPRNDDNQLLGYAIRNVKVGREGLAIVLFE